MIAANCLPPGWQAATLKDCCGKPEYGLTCSAEEGLEGPKLLRITDIQEGNVNWDNVPSCRCDKNILDKYSLHPGDVVIARIGATTGKSYLIRDSVNSIFASYLIRIRTGDKILPDFLYAFTKSRYYRSQIEANKGGRLKGGVTIPILQGLSLALPPLSEQKKITKILNSVQESKEKTERVIEALGWLKKSMVKHLFLYGAIDFSKVPEVELIDTEIGPVPKHWTIMNVGAVVDDITVGVVVKPASFYVTSGVPALRSLNVREDQLELDDLVYFSEKDNDTILVKSKLKEGDVLIVRTGYPGTSCVVPKELEGANCIDIIRARTKKEVMVPNFLSRFFNSEVAHKQIQTNQVGMAQKHLNVGAIKRMKMPVPSLFEQNQIVYTLQSMDKSICVEKERLASLNTLFESLLDNLITGHVRVKDVEVPT